MTTIRQLLEETNSDPWAVDPDDSVFNAISEMALRNVGALLVMEGEKIVGLITERSYTRNIILKGRNSFETPVCDIMTEIVTQATPDQSLTDCWEKVEDAKIRHLPVVDNGQVIAMVSIRDLTKRIINDQKKIIEELQGSDQV